MELISFPLRGVDFDNDGLSMNEPVITWCRQKGLDVTRSRAYRENDQAWVEQKNGAIARRLVGHGRLMGLVSAQVLARLYAAARLHTDLFQPSFKLSKDADRRPGHQALSSTRRSRSSSLGTCRCRRRPQGTVATAAVCLRSGHADRRNPRGPGGSRQTGGSAWSGGCPRTGACARSRQVRRGTSDRPARRRAPPDPPSPLSAAEAAAVARFDARRFARADQAFCASTAPPGISHAPADSGVKRRPELDPPIASPTDVTEIAVSLAERVVPEVHRGTRASRSNLRESGAAMRGGSCGPSGASRGRIKLPAAAPRRRSQWPFRG